MQYKLKYYQINRIKSIIIKTTITLFILISLLAVLLYGEKVFFSQDLSKYIESRITFDHDGVNLIHRDKLAYLNFIDGFPRFAAHRASTFLETYAEAIASISESDANLANVKDPDRFINVFFGSNYFSGGSITVESLPKKYKRSMNEHLISDETPVFDSMEILERGCYATRHIDNSIIGSTFLVIDEDIPDVEVERCLFLGVSYAFGINSTHGLASPVTTIDRNVDILVHSSAQQCLGIGGKLSLIQCIDRKIQASFGRSF